MEPIGWRNGEREQPSVSHTGAIAIEWSYLIGCIRGALVGSTYARGCRRCRQGELVIGACTMYSG